MNTVKMLCCLLILLNGMNKQYPTLEFCTSLDASIAENVHFEAALVKIPSNTQLLITNTEKRTVLCFLRSTNVSCAEIGNLFTTKYKLLTMELFQRTKNKRSRKRLQKILTVGFCCCNPTNTNLFFL